MNDLTILSFPFFFFSSFLFCCCRSYSSCGVLPEFDHVHQHFQVTMQALKGRSNLIALEPSSLHQYQWRRCAACQQCWEVWWCRLFTKSPLNFICLVGRLSWQLASSSWVSDGCVFCLVVFSLIFLSFFVLFLIVLLGQAHVLNRSILLGRAHVLNRSTKY